MSSVILIEQRPPFIIMLASRIPTYANIIISLFAVLLFQAFPSWTIAKPPIREVTRKRRSTSLTSSVSTLVDPDESVVVKKEVADSYSEKGKHHRVSFSSRIPFNKLDCSVKMVFSPSKSMKPKLPRRLTLPARRFSTHVVATLQNLTPHHHRHNNADSYFVTKKTNTEDMNLAGNNVPVITGSESKPVATTISVTQTNKVETVIEGDRGNIKQRESCITNEPAQKRRTLKQFARRASTMFQELKVHRP